MRPSLKPLAVLFWWATLLQSVGAPLSLSAQTAAEAPTAAAERASSTAGAASSRPTVVLLVRHAEKAAAPADDPPLSEGGVERARTLAAAVSQAGVTAIVVTPRLRTRATAQPLADARRLTPESVPLGGSAASHAAAVAAAVRRHAGGVVLVVGHSNTVPAIIAALGGPALPDLCDAEYSNLFVLVIEPASGARAGAGTPADAVHLVRSRYGRPDDPGAMRACAAMTPH